MTEKKFKMKFRKVFFCDIKPFADRINYLLNVILFFGIIRISHSQRCSSPNITDYQFNYGYTFEKELSLGFYGVFESFQMTGTESISLTSNNNWDIKYLDARYARGLLEIYTTSSFRRYVEEQSSTRINLQVKMVCEDQSNPILIFRINIKRENLYDPEFSKSTYNFSIPLPLYKGFDLTTFEKITARDVDIFDNKVTFSSNSSGIVSVQTSGDISEDGKTFSAKLILTSPLILLSSPLEFLITATDIGQPPRSKTARIRIFADQATILTPPPQFEKTMYTGKLSESLSVEIENLILVTETWSDDIKYEKIGIDADLFSFVTSRNRLQVRLTRPLTEDDIQEKGFLGFSIVARRSDELTGSCTVVIEIPRKSSEHRFTKNYYSGSLDKYGNFSVEPISYSMEDYSPDLTFILTGPDAYLFAISNNEFIVQVNFTGDISSINFKNRRYFFTILSALKNNLPIANAGLTILLPIVPRFSKAIYSGLIDKNSKITLESIHFESNVASEIRSVDIRGNYSDSFSLKGSREGLQLDLVKPFDELEIRSLKTVQLTIIAVSRADTEGSADILIKFPDFLAIPEFENSLYKGQVEKNGTLIMDSILLRKITYTSNITFQLDGEFADIFRMNITENVVRLELTRSIPTFVLQAEKYLNLILSARNSDGDAGSTAIILDLPTFTPPEFTKASYKGALDRYYQLNIEDILIKDTSYETGIDVALEGRDAKFFKAKLSTLNVQLEINDATLNPDELIGKIALNVEVIAKNKDGLTGRTIVIVEIPFNCANGNVTCPPCITKPNQTCPESTTPDPNSTPVFDRKLYLYRIDPYHTGVIGIVAARIPDSNELIKYSLDVSNDHLRPRITVNQNSGELSAHDIVSPGLYTFKAIASNPLTGAEGYALIRLTVDAANICPNDTVVVSSSFLVKHVAEKEVHTDLLNTKYGRCSFIIHSMQPDDKEYVKIDPRTNQLTTMAIDRESKAFESMIVPQVIVQLKLNCPETVNNRRRRSLVDSYSIGNDSRSLVLIDDIPFDPYLTTMSIIVEDINDHSPEFIHPPKGNYIVGYPELDVYYNLMPDYLIKVEATDRDSGIHAKIRYSLGANDYFQIDPISGIIYPMAVPLGDVESFELVVTATDCDGAPSGLRTQIKIIAKLLLSDHLTLLVISNQQSQHFESILKNISRYFGADVYSLRQAMVPARSEEPDLFESQESSASRSTKNQRMILRAWIYVVDNEGQLVSGTEVEKKLEDVHNLLEFEATPYSAYSKSDELIVDAVGLVAGIAVLGALLVIAIVAAFLFWWFWLRPYNFKSTSNETISETVSSEGSEEHEVKYKSGNQFYYEEGAERNARQQYKTHPAIPISGTTNCDTSDESNTNSLEGYSNNSDNSDSSRGQNERRKSIVTFNELVERIDIEVNDNTNFRHRSNNDDDERL